jgi:glycogen debranching enzyme
MLGKPPDTLIRLRPRSHLLYVGRGRSVLATARDGFVHGEGEQGLFVSQTRLLSRYRYRVNGEAVSPIALSGVEAHSWLGYYLLPLRAGREGAAGGIGGRSGAPEMAQQAVELRLSRSVDDGFHEDLDVTNFTQEPAAFALTLEVDADFADADETTGPRQQEGRLTRLWRDDGEAWELAFDYAASRAYRHPGETGTATLQRGAVLRLERCDTPPQHADGRIRWEIALPPHAIWHACLTLLPVPDGTRAAPAYRCRAFGIAQNERDAKGERFLANATAFRRPETDTLGPAVVACLGQAVRDLAALRLHDLDQADGAWTVAAGLPVYLSLFGRDTLTAAWQAGLVSPALMRGTLAELARWQGREENDWRDEQPGRMLHEAQRGPLALLNVIPLGRYYGSITTSAFYPVVVSELWHWTGDRAQVQPFVEPALRALRWLDAYADPDGDGFYEYRSRSPQGVKHQAWKDSGDAVVYEDGTEVKPPIATCEEQGFVYLAKLHMAELLWWLDRRDEAKRLYNEAGELKRKFNEAFWMEEEGFFALGLDAQKRQIRSIASNPGHCIATAIVDGSLVPRAAGRLFADDLFSGWGIRTLSARHPAYNPYSYHRGTVWPVEQGTFALGLYRYGLHRHVELLSRAQFEAATLFDFHRLPECFTGHPRDTQHPFPAVYPNANSPQAWSASATFNLLQALLGLYPYAPLRLLVVDPHLPDWLPEITLANLWVGDAVVTIRFFRRRNGTSDYRVLSHRGRLHVVRQPSPWSLTAGPAERLVDVLTSLLPGR